MLLSEILGLEKIKKELMSSYSQNRIAHAQLFNGPKGSGKLAIALAYAQLINCEFYKKNDSCGTCSSCLKYLKIAHPDLHIIYPVIKKSSTDKPTSDDFISLWRENILSNPYQSLDKWMGSYKEMFIEKVSNKKKEGVIYAHQIKELNRKLSVKIYEAKNRVVIIWMPEKMNIKAANKFLKILEEPPLRTILLLVSENKISLLTTVLSRLQIIDIPRYTVNETISFFSDNKTSGFLNHCKRSNGDLGNLYNYNEDLENQDNFIENFSSLMRVCFKNNIVEISSWVDQVSVKTRENQIKIISYSISLMRECIIYNFSDKKINNLSEKEVKFIKNFSLYIHEENSLHIISIFESIIKNIQRNANSKIILFDMSLRLVKLLKLKRKFV
tara:strand:- start:538 stop:1692 length:1155 start_codon:yes stop_codon:yes gene_type:complete